MGSQEREGTSGEIATEWREISILDVDSDDVLDLIIAVDNPVQASTSAMPHLVNSAYAASAVTRLELHSASFSTFALRSAVLRDYDERLSPKFGCISSSIAGISVGQHNWFGKKTNICGSVEMDVGMSDTLLDLQLVAAGGGRLSVVGSVMKQVLSAANVAGRFRSGNTVLFSISSNELEHMKFDMMDAGIHKVDLYLIATVRNAALITDFRRYLLPAPIDLKHARKPVRGYVLFERYTGDDRYQERNENQGGDSWGRRHVVNALSSAKVVGAVGARVGDISNMNGGSFKPAHDSHVIGLDVDIQTANMGRTNRGRPSTKEAGQDLVKLLDTNLGPLVKVVWHTFRDDNSNEFWKRVRAECLSHGRSARSVAAMMRDHDHHFHFRFVKEAKKRFEVPEGQRPQKPSFVFRMKTSNPLEVEIKRDSKAAIGSEYSYGIFKDGQFLASVDEGGEPGGKYDCSFDGEYTCVKLPGPGVYTIKAISIGKFEDIESCSEHIEKIRLKEEPYCLSEDHTDSEFGKNQVWQDGRIGGFIAENAVVEKGALVGKRAEICGNSQVSADSEVFEKARVSNSKLLERNVLMGNAIVKNNATVTNSYLAGNVEIKNAANVDQTSFIQGRSLASGEGVKIWNSSFNGDVEILSEATVENSFIENSAYISGGASLRGVYSSSLLYAEQRAIVVNSTFAGPSDVELVSGEVYKSFFDTPGVISISNRAYVYNSRFSGAWSLSAGDSVMAMNSYVSSPGVVILSGDAYLSDSTVLSKGDVTLTGGTLADSYITVGSNLEIAGSASLIGSYVDCNQFRVGTSAKFQQSVVYHCGDFVLNGSAYRTYFLNGDSISISGDVRESSFRTGAGSINIGGSVISSYFYPTGGVTQTGSVSNSYFWNKGDLILSGNSQRIYSGNGGALSVLSSNSVWVYTTGDYSVQNMTNKRCTCFYNSSYYKDGRLVYSYENNPHFSGDGTCRAPVAGAGWINFGATEKCVDLALIPHRVK